MKTSFKLFDFAGAPVELSIWFFLIFLFTPISWAIAIFFSVLIHELAHAYVADRRGWRVYGIRVDLFSGSASVDTNIPERDSIPVVAAGPISNLLLSLITTGLFVIFGTTSHLVGKFLLDLCIVNIIMFGFNILPIYPMDGGRLLKDFLLIKMPSRSLANKISGYTSLLFSVALLMFSLSISAVILTIFSALFIYTSLIETGLINKS